MILAAGVIIDLFISTIWFLNSIHSYEEGRKEEKYEAAIIFMGDFNFSYTALGKQTLRRLNFALDLQQAGTVTKFLCVGGSRPGKNIYGAELMKKYLQQHGVPENNIFSETQSFDSKSNWSQTLKIIEEKRWHSVCLISSPLHLKRLQTITIAPGKELAIFPKPFSYSAAKPKITRLELWRHIHHEWIAYFLYTLPEPVYNQIVGLLRPQG